MLSRVGLHPLFADGIGALDEVVNVGAGNDRNDDPRLGVVFPLLALADALESP